MSEEETPKEEDSAVPKESSQMEKTTDILQMTSATCPIPPEHVKLFEECCSKYEKGEMTDAEVMEKVRASLKGLKKGE